MRSRVAMGAAALALGGCGSGLAAVAPGQKPGAKSRKPVAAACAQRTGFALSLVSDRGGRPTPTAAATWLARHGDVPGIPRGGWRLTKQDRNGATVTSGRSVLHAVLGGDGTWQVDSGFTCG